MEYCLNTEKCINEYRAFSGRLSETMPKLCAEGYKPISVAQIMKRRLNTDPNSIHWDGYSFVTGDAVVYHPSGRMKIVRGAIPLLEVNIDSELESEWPHRLVLGKGVYESLEGLELTSEDQIGVISRPFIPFNPSRVKSNPIWKYLSRSQNLLNTFVDKRIDVAEDSKLKARSMQINFNSSPFANPENLSSTKKHLSSSHKVRRVVLEAIEFSSMTVGFNACLGDCRGFNRDHPVLIGFRKISTSTKSA